MTEPNTLSVRSFVDDDKLEKDTQPVTDATLTEAMANQPGLTAWYGAQAARATQQLNQFKRMFDLVDAQLYDRAIEHFAALAEDGDKPPTEGRLRAWIRKDSRYRKMAGLLDQAIFECDRAKLAFEAIKERRRMITDLGHYRREEMKGDIAVHVNSARVGTAIDRRSRFAEARDRIRSSDNAEEG